MINKQIHRDEIKLRILLTNKCNQNCGFCLNDFQPKGESFLYEDRALQAMTFYSLYFTGKVPLQVYFSGGEPTLHNCLPTFLQYAKRLGCRTTLNTNGIGLVPKIYDIRDTIDCLHVGVYRIDQELGAAVALLKGDIQSVYSKRFPHVTPDFIDYYTELGKHYFNTPTPIKIFKDIYEENDYEDFARRMLEMFPHANLSFRHTGIQENRGEGCYGCDKKCVTLKAAWVFPDGGVSPCPQLYKAQKMYPMSPNDWLDAYSIVHRFHKVED